MIALFDAEVLMNDTRSFFYGLGLGVAAGVLLAPRAGVKTREMIADTAREGQDYVARSGAELRDTVRDKVNRTKRAAKATAEGLEVAFEVGKEELIG
jgi:gas vesicle protein